ncbi:hypothetical protein DFS34DRAFT_584447, partial [Phlyctochytrium arcticum]
ESSAREIIVELAHEIGLRVVGTHQEHMSRDMIVRKLKELQDQAERLGQHDDIKEKGARPKLEVDVQVVDGSHRFEIMGQAVLKTYTNITNVVARLSCGPACDENAILLNSHFDSTIVSPGASDDGVGVAVMLELVRVLLHRSPTQPLRNAVIFLWNGAEETLQDASHGFITQHPWRSSVRGLINLEAMGQGGKEILFQANSEQMIKAYQRVPHPHGSVISNDVFRTGLIMSDTDYRQFVDYGELAGLDMAFYTNSYLYHTMLDVEETIEDGSIQNFGENTLAMLEYLLYEADLSKIEINTNIVFFDVLGLWFFHYSWATAHLLHGLVMSTAILTILATSPFKHLPLYLNVAKTAKTAFAVFSSNILSIAFGALMGLGLYVSTVRQMVWFSREWYALIMFVPGCFAGAETATSRAKKDLTAGENSGDPLYERAAYNGIMLVLVSKIALAGIFRVGASYLLALYLCHFILGLVLDSLLTRRKGNGIQPLHPAAYFAASFPFIFTTELSQCTLDLFVPITGRTGPHTPVDLIVGILTGLLTYFHTFGLLPLAYRVKVTSLRRAVRGLILLGCATIGFFVLFVPAYDQMHPKRVFVEYKENVTAGTREILIGHADPAGFTQVLETVQKEFGVQPTLRDELRTDRDWSTIYPFSHFMESFSFDISHLPTPTPSAASAPTLQVLSSTTDDKAKTRTLTLHCAYPNYIWTVLSFDAHVLDWSLSDKSLIDPHTTKPYKIRNAGGYGTAAWNMTITLRNTGPVLMEISGLERDTFHEMEADVRSPQERRERGRLVGTKAGQGVAVGRSWKWTDRWGSATVLSRVERVMPDWVTGLYLGVVINRFEV